MRDWCWPLGREAVDCTEMSQLAHVWKERRKAIQERHSSGLKTKTAAAGSALVPGWGTGAEYQGGVPEWTLGGQGTQGGVPGWKTGMEYQGGGQGAL